MVQFTCWKCETVLLRVESEYLALSAWVRCPKEECREMNTLTYRFPEGRTEVI